MILIVGGGFTGIGVGLALLESGYKDFLILESKTDILLETSANSFRIIHSGIRFLPRLKLIEFLSSFKACSELKTRFSEFIVPRRCNALLSDKVFLPFNLDFGVFKLERRQLFSREGIFLTWEDGFIQNLDGLRNHLKGILAEHIIFNSEVKGIDYNHVMVSNDFIKFDTLILCCFPSFNYFNFSSVWAWNIITPYQGSNIDEIVGFRSGERYLFASYRENNLAFGTWYSDAPPSRDDIRSSLLDVYNLFGINVDKYDLEVGILPSKNNRDPICKSYILQGRHNIWSIYPNKLTTFLEIGRYVTRKLL